MLRTACVVMLQTGKLKTFPMLSSKHPSFPLTLWGPPTRTTACVVTCYRQMRTFANILLFHDSIVSARSTHTLRGIREARHFDSQANGIFVSRGNSYVYFELFTKKKKKKKKDHREKNQNNLRCLITENIHLFIYLLYVYLSPLRRHSFT